MTRDIWFALECSYKKKNDKITKSRIRNAIIVEKCTVVHHTRSVSIRDVETF